MFEVILCELKEQLIVALKAKEDKEEIKLALALKEVIQFYMEPDEYKKFIENVDCDHIKMYDSSKFVIGL